MAHRQASDDQPEGRGNDAVGEVFSQALDRGASNARFVQTVGIAADDHRHGCAAGLQTLGFQRFRDCADMLVKTALGQKAAGREDQNARADRPVG